MAILFSTLILQMVWYLSRASNSSIPSYDIYELCDSTQNIERAFAMYIEKKDTVTDKCVIRIQARSDQRLSVTYDYGRDYVHGFVCKHNFEIYFGGPAPYENGSECTLFLPPFDLTSPSNIGGITLYGNQTTTSSFERIDVVIVPFHNGTCDDTEYRCSDGRCIDGNLRCHPTYQTCGNRGCYDSISCFDGPSRPAWPSVIASFLTLLSIILVCFCCWRKRQARRKHRSSTNRTVEGLDIPVIPDIAFVLKAPAYTPKYPPPPYSSLPKDTQMQDDFKMVDRAKEGEMTLFPTENPPPYEKSTTSP